MPTGKKDTAPLVGPKPNKTIKKKTRQLIAQEMVTSAMAQGWYETAENPRKPDAEIAVDVLDSFTDVARSIAERQDITEDVTHLAALCTAWLQNLTYSGKRSWS